jgi:Ca2+/Na+ antiporter
MKKRLSAYLKFLEDVKTSPALLADFDPKEMAFQIKLFQQERLIHLIVTLFIALLAFLSVIYISLVTSLAFLALCLIFFILLAFYLRHYYFLENKVQELYSIYDEIKKLKNEMHY